MHIYIYISMQANNQPSKQRHRQTDDNHASSRYAITHIQHSDRNDKSHTHTHTRGRTTQAGQ